MKYRTKLTFTQQLLGATPIKPHIYTDYLAKEALDKNLDVEPEFAAVRRRIKEIEQNGDLEAKKTVFLRDGNTPVLSNHVIKGYFKEACAACKRRDDAPMHSAKITAYKTKIDTLIFVSPRLIPIRLTKPVGERQDPLRADTPRGTQVAIAWRETIEPGASLEFTLTILSDATFTEPLLREWLDYGQYIGIGTWRTADYGQFTYTLEPLP